MSRLKILTLALFLACLVLDTYFWWQATTPTNKNIYGAVMLSDIVIIGIVFFWRRKPTGRPPNPMK